MGSYLNCSCKNLDNQILDGKFELFNSKGTESYYNINQELPKDFPHDPEEEYNNIFYEEKIIYDITNMKQNEIIKFKKLFEFSHQHGKPRSSNDFNPNHWTKYYPDYDQFFTNQDPNIKHNQLILYNKNDSNNIKIYQGDINIYGQRHGTGKLTTKYKVLIGLWKNDNFCGWGRESRCNGDVFEGRFENGRLNGKGVFINDKNDKYIGEFKNMKRWGKGKLLTEQILYEGEFNNDQIEGVGKIIFLKSRTEYTGIFKEGKIEGYGRFKWSNGEKYEGEVKDGKMHGAGKYFYKNGKIFEGYFDNGKKVEKKKGGSNLNKTFFPEKHDIDFYDYFEPDINNNFSVIHNNTNSNLLSTYRNFGFGDQN